MLQTKDPELASAEKIVEDFEERRREADRILARPRHFHATVFTYVSKDDHGNFVDSLHHEVIGLSVDACVRKARHRGERKHEQYHVAQLTECSESGHSAGMTD